MKHILISIAFFFSFFTIKASEEAYSLASYYTFSLQFEQARKQIEICKKSKDFQIQALYLENYIDFITVVITQSPQKFKIYTENTENIYEKIEKLEDDSPYKLYAMSQIKFNSMVSNFLFGNNMTAGWDVFRSKKLLTENKKKFPNFLENSKLSGMFDIFFSAIPSEYKWVADGIGLNSNLTRGFSTLKKYQTHYNNDTLLNAESTILTALLLMQFTEDKNVAYDFLKKKTLIKTNSLAKYVYCRIAASNSKNDEIITLLQNFKQKSGELDVAFFDFLLAKAKLNKLDLTAETHYKEFLRTYSGKNYLKLVYQRLSWIALFQNNNEKYQQYLDKTKKEGVMLVVEDKQAYAEITNRKKVNKLLLSGRLYYDGAYYEKALAEINKCVYTSLDATDKLEFNYRKAQIYYKQKKLDLAINYFLDTIKLGSKTEYYYAPYSAINLALIYKEKGDLIKAEAYFKKALEINNGEQKSIIEIKAKNGLKSLKI